MAKPIISFISLILSIGFAFLYVVPAYNLNIERRGDIASLSKILSTSGEIKTLIDKTKDNLKGIDPTVLARFNVFLPEKIDSIRFANNIQNIGVNNRIILSGIKVEAPAGGAAAKTNTTTGAGSVVQGLVNIMSIGAQIDKAQGEAAQSAATASDSTSTGGAYVATSASFTFTATYETFQLFLNDLERSLGLINVKTLSFALLPEDTSSKSSKVSSAPTYQFAMTIETYSLQ